MDLTQTQAELSRLTQRVMNLEGRPIPTADPQISRNKTSIERLDMILTHHQTEIAELTKQLDDFKLQILPIKKKSLWERIIK